MKTVYSHSINRDLKQIVHVCSLTLDDGEVVVVDGVYAEGSGITQEAAKRELQERMFAHFKRAELEGHKIMNLISNSCVKKSKKQKSTECACGNPALEDGNICQKCSDILSW